MADPGVDGDEYEWTVGGYLRDPNGQDDWLITRFCGRGGYGTRLQLVSRVVDDWLSARCPEF